MGLFGGNELKRLDTESEASHMAFSMMGQMPEKNVQQMIDNVGDDILGAAVTLAAVETARVPKAPRSDDAFSQILDQVLEKLPD